MAGWLLAAALGFVAWTYAGYPLLCWLRARLAPLRFEPAPIRPRVSILIAALREAAHLEAKIESLAAQSYPAALLELVVACDGGDPATVEQARRATARCFPGRSQVIALSERRGKPSALAAARAVATGEVLVLNDARQRLSPEAVERLVEALADRRFGAVGGQLVLEGDAPVSAYWRYESLIRRLQGGAAATIGVSGAIYAIRQELFTPLPAETILDDVLVPARVRLAGLRVAYEPAAQAFDRVAETGREFTRKVRTLSGNFQLLALEPRLLSPLHNPGWFDFVSHKLCRLAVPWALAVALVASVMMPAPWRWLLLAGQVAGYGAAAARGAGLLARSRLAALCETFVVLNAAAVWGLGRFMRHGRRLPWS